MFFQSKKSEQWNLFKIMLLITFYPHVLNWLQNLTVHFIYIYVYLTFSIHSLFKRILLLIVQQMSQN